MANRALFEELVRLGLNPAKGHTISTINAAKHKLAEGVAEVVEVPVEAVEPAIEPPTPAPVVDPVPVVEEPQVAVAEVTETKPEETVITKVEEEVTVPEPKVEDVVAETSVDQKDDNESKTSKKPGKKKN